MRSLIPLFLCSLNALNAAAMSAATVDLVKARLKESAQKSWELGTRAQALLELDSPSVSVFTASSIPGSPAARGSSGTNVSSVAPVTNAAKIALASGQLKDVLAITTDIVSSKAAGTLPLMKDGSAADPASNGVAVLVANWTGAQGSDFGAAAEDQLSWLLNDVPRSSMGAISHRNKEVQLWSDFIYMVPPFLAYYGATTSNQTLLTESYRQIKLYRDVLLDKSGLWQHVRQGSFEDKGLWSTGNGWAAMGMMRVAATIKAAGYESEFTDELKDLSDWTAGIFDGMWPLLTSDNLFYNYANNPKTFLDGASSALLAASVYRAAVLFDNTDHIAAAEKVYTAIGGPDSTSTPSASSSSSSSTSSTSTSTPQRRSHSRRTQPHRVPLHLTHLHSSRATDHLTADGWLTPVVDPHAFHKVGEQSAEGQAFVVMMYAARNDWLAKGGVGQKGKENVAVGGSGGAAANVVGVGVVGGSPASVGDGSGNGGGGLNGVGNVGGSANTTTNATTTTTASASTNTNGAQRGASIGLGALVGGILVACFA